MEHLESLSRLEERIQRAVDVIVRLKAENKRLQQEAAQVAEGKGLLERRVAELDEEKEELVREGRLLREKEQQWVRFERDREEIRSRIDGMLAKFEELEI